MKRIMLIRHAKSSWAYEPVNDLLRPLNGRGYRNLPVMAMRNILYNNPPDLICCSHAIRAYSTALGLCHALSINIDKLNICPWLYTASANEILLRLHPYWDDNELLWLIGHNPTLENLVRLLLPNSCIEVPTLGCVLLAQDEATGTWLRIGADAPKKNV